MISQSSSRSWHIPLLPGYLLRRSLSIRVTRSLIGRAPTCLLLASTHWTTTYLRRPTDGGQVPFLPPSLPSHRGRLPCRQARHRYFSPSAYYPLAVSTQRWTSGTASQAAHGEGRPSSRLPARPSLAAKLVAPQPPSPLRLNEYILSTRYYVQIACDSTPDLDGREGLTLPYFLVLLIAR